MQRYIRPIRTEGNTAFIALTRGYETIIDVEDIPLVNDRCWCALVSRTKTGKTSPPYAMSSTGTLLHRRLLGAEKGDIVDHANGDTLDNRRANLRFCSHAENMRNRAIHCNNSSGYTGVHFNSAKQRWCAEIYFNNERIRLGSFHAKEDAAKAYEEKSVALFGAFKR